MKLVLVSSPARDSPEALPLGAASVAAAIGAAEWGSEIIQVDLIDAKPEERPEALASRVASAGPDAVGFSVYSWNREALGETARLLRASSPGLVTFAGGPEATSDPGSLALEAGLDFVVAGEGESATVRALSAIAAARREAPEGARSEALLVGLREIPGVVVPGSPWRQSPPEVPSALPSPWLLGTIDPASCGGDVVWELARGCPFRCAYCYESKGSRGTRPFPMERVEAELELFVRSGVRYAFVLDPTFDANPVRASALLDLFRERAPGLRWKFEVRAELLDKALVRRFAALDCSLQIGLQSVRPATLATVGRPGFDRREFARKVAMLSQAGLSFGIDLIYGLPGDALADFEEGVDFALGLEPNHLDLFPLALLPGTELAGRATELGIEADPKPPYLVRSTRELPAADFGKADLLAKATDRFYSSGRAVGWFGAARKPLRLGPSALLREYWAFLKARDLDGARGAGDEPRAGEGRRIEEEQLAFLERAYAAAGHSSLVPALRDLVRLHGAWGRALAEGEESVLELSYDPEEALGAATLGLAAFARGATRSRARWRVVPDEDEGARIEGVASR